MRPCRISGSFEYLEVAGDYIEVDSGSFGEVSASHYLGNRIDITGTGSFGFIEKSAGSFKINHPNPEKSDDYTLHHSFVESPTAGDNIYRYKVNVNYTGQTTIKLPEYWEYLNENPQVWVSAERSFSRAYGYVENNQIVIKAESSGIYNVLLIGTRKDIDATKHWNGVERKK